MGHNNMLWSMKGMNKQQATGVWLVVRIHGDFTTTRDGCVDQRMVIVTNGGEHSIIGKT